MKKLFLTLVAVISCCSNLFAQSADVDDSYPLFIETEVKYANSYNAGAQVSIEDICDFTVKNQNGEVIQTGEDIAVGTKVTISFTKFYDELDYKLMNITLNGQSVVLDNGSYTFSVDDFSTVSVEIAKVMYEYSNAGTFVSLYDGTSDREMYEFAGIYGNKVYGIPTKNIVAGKPYIAQSGGYTLNFDISKSAIRDFSDKDYNGFYPSNSDLKLVSGNDYLVFNNGELGYSSASGDLVPIGAAYFVADEAVKSGTPSANAKVVMNLSIESTGIANVVVDDANTSPIYNLSGQCVSNATRGIYVVKGKKVLVK